MNAGDRIRLVEMPNDPSPVIVGTTGTIERVTDFGEFTIFDMAWDDGRSLNIVAPPDRYEPV